MTAIPSTVDAKPTATVGIISDTHGRLPSSVARTFQKTDLIVHAGDIGSEQVLIALKRMAPVIAVCGNMDYGSWSTGLDTATVLRVGGINLYLCHILDESDKRIQDCQVVVYGHTHRPVCRRRGGILYLNPGSAGDARHAFPPSVALLKIVNTRARASIVALAED